MLIKSDDHTPIEPRRPLLTWIVPHGMASLILKPPAPKPLEPKPTLRKTRYVETLRA